MLESFLFWKKQPTEKQIARTVRKLTETHGDPAIRQEAAEKLASWGTPEAIAGLLRRFTIQASQLTLDQDEKRQVIHRLVELGEVTVEPLVDFLKKQPEVNWPAQALSQILTEEEYIRRMLEVLRYLRGRYVRASEHKAHVIRLVEGFSSPELQKAVEGFLEEEDDDVRIAAIDYLAGETPEVRESLLELFVQSEGRPRVRRHILELFAEKEWPVRGYRRKIEENLPEGFYLTGKGIIRQQSRA